MQLRPVTAGARLTLAVAAIVAVTVALAGLVIVLRVDRGERAAVDRALAARATEVSKAAAKSGSLPTDGTYAVRVVAGGRVSAQKGAATQFSIPVKDGYSTVTAADGSQWRSLAQPLKSGAQLQLLINLSDVEERHAGNIRTINVAVLLAALIAAAGVRLTAELAQRRRRPEDPQPDDPPAALAVPGATASPGAVAGDADSPGVGRGDAASAVGAGSPNGAAPPRDSAPPEAGATAEAEAGEAALVRLFRDPVAAVGTGLETLLDNPDMSPTQRHLVLAAVQTEHRRLLELLEALEAPERHA